MASSSRAVSATVVANGPGLVEARGVGDDPVAGHPPVGRPQPDHPAQRRRLADRPAGVGAERQGREPGRHRRRAAARRPARHPGQCPRGWPSGRTPSSRWSCPWRTRRGWSCRSRPRRPPAAGPRRSSRTAAASPRGSATRRSSAGPGCRTCPSPPPARRPAGRARRPGPGRRRPRRRPPGRRRRRRRGRTAPPRRAPRCGPGGRRSPPPPTPRRPRTSAASSAAVRPDQPVGAHASSARIRGTRKRPSSAAGRHGQHHVPVEAGRGSSGRSTLASGNGMRRGRHVGGVEGRHLGGVLQDGAELAGELLDLLLRQGEAGELGDVLDVGPGEGVGHDRDCRVAAAALAFLSRFVRFW